VAEINLATLNTFVRKHGNIKFIDLKGKARTLTSGKPDAFDLAEKADRFFHAGKWYTRQAFSKLLDEL
jgi:hypothetical protein